VERSKKKKQKKKGEGIHAEKEGVIPRLSVRNGGKGGFLTDGKVERDKYNLDGIHIIGKKGRDHIVGRKRV